MVAVVGASMVDAYSAHWGEKSHKIREDAIPTMHKLGCFGCSFESDMK